MLKFVLREPRWLATYPKVILSVILGGPPLLPSLTGPQMLVTIALFHASLSYVIIDVT